ncbi:NUDIX hydrolase [Streptomyces phaeoluteigriseus]
MTPEQDAPGSVDAVVVYDGRLLLVDVPGGWGLPSGVPEPAESPRATAARLVYELTGYLVDGSSPLDPRGSAVVCQLLTRDPSGEGRLTPEQSRWVPFAEAIGVGGLPESVRVYLEGHTPV